MPRISLPERILCLVTALDPDEDPTSLLAAVGLAVRGGVNMVQVRAPELERTAFFNLAAEVMESVGDDAVVIINNRVDVALAVDAGGVQLGERGPAVNAARRMGGDEWQIGRSVHSVEGAVKAQADQADFLLLGTLFETNSHPGQRGDGLDLVRQVGETVNLPIIGTGGINLERAREVMAAGAKGVAISSAILSADDPEQAAAELKQEIENA